MKTNIRFIIWLWVLLCVPFLLASCENSVHDDAVEGGLSVSLSWADQADQGTAVNDIKLWIFNADDGSLVEEKRYASAQEMASQRFQLPTGNYQILAAANLIAPFSIDGQTSAVTNWNNIQIGLTDSYGVKANAYFGVTNVRIGNNSASYVVQVPIKSVLAELSVNIENVPDGTEMKGKALDCAQCLLPTLKNGDGDYGLPGRDSVEVDFPTIHARESALQSDVIRLMPTVQGHSTSHIYLRLLLPNGTPQEYDITAPAMKAGGKYELRLKYNDMKPKMNLEATINDWTDLNGEVEIK